MQTTTWTSALLLCFENVVLGRTKNKGRLWKDQNTQAVHHRENGLASCVGEIDRLASTTCTAAVAATTQADKTPRRRRHSTGTSTTTTAGIWPHQQQQRQQHRPFRSSITTSTAAITTAKSWAPPCGGGGPEPVCFSGGGGAATPRTYPLESTSCRHIRWRRSRGQQHVEAALFGGRERWREGEGGRVALDTCALLHCYAPGDVRAGRRGGVLPNSKGERERRSEA